MRRDRSWPDLAVGILVAVVAIKGAVKILRDAKLDAAKEMEVPAHDRRCRCVRVISASDVRVFDYWLARDENVNSLTDDRTQKAGPFKPARAKLAAGPGGAINDRIYRTL